jgi:YesN/AraC family two-component response regulator
MYKLLVVDDEADILFFLKSYFQTKDFEVSTAQSGEEAIGKVKEIRPHIVLMDIIMPGMGGLEALKKIKEIDPAIGGDHGNGRSGQQRRRTGHCCGVPMTM